MVKDAVDHGYLERRTSPHDRRRVTLQLTIRGNDLATSARQWQQQQYEQLTSTWSARDRNRLARYLQRLAEENDA